VTREQPLGTASARRALDALHDKPLNFDLSERAQVSREGGWEIEDYCEPLPSEPPGEPVSGGSWEVAKQLITDYEFADPSIIRAVYKPDQPLEQRNMLLVARLWGLRFRIGVRVGDVISELRVVDGRQVRVWGWNYQTLQGHLEMGQTDYEVWKWLDRGTVEFRIHRFSRSARTGNPLVRLGFRLFGRRKAMAFAEHACKRMRLLTEAELGQGRDKEDVPRIADHTSIREE